MDGASPEHCPCPTSLLVPFGNQRNCIRGADPRLQGAPLPENPTPNACGCLRSQRVAVMEGCRDGSGWPKRPTAGREGCGRARGRTRRPGVPRDRSRRCVPPPTGAAAPAAGAGPAAAVPSSPVPAAPAPGTEEPRTPSVVSPPEGGEARLGRRKGVKSVAALQTQALWRSRLTGQGQGQGAHGEPKCRGGRGGARTGVRAAHVPPGPRAQTAAPRSPAAVK